MSEDSSSDDEWCVSTKKRTHNAHPKAKCWECGKRISNLKSLMLHYKSHDIKATCHICRVTFRRLTSLSVHLDNAHSPPFCSECHQSFSNVWELNKHAGTNCKTPLPFQDSSSFICKRQNGGNFPKKVTARQSTDSVLPESLSDSRPEQRIDVTLKRVETSENSVEYVLGEDDNDNSMESDCEKDDDSADSESDDETLSSSGLPRNSGKASDSSDAGTAPSDHSLTCTKCGRGPFMSMKLHLMHCGSVKTKYQCVLCKTHFLTVKDLREHHKPLHCCELCLQVFPQQPSHYCNQCPKGGKLILVLFCSNSMPKVCKICKSLFLCDKTLSVHVNNVHSPVATNGVIVPSELNDKTSLPGVKRIKAQSGISTSCAEHPAINGKLCIGQNYAASHPSLMKSSPSSLPTSLYPGMTSALKDEVSAAATVSQPSGDLSAPVSGLPSTNGPTPDTAAPNAGSSSMPTILAWFENVSETLALMKRMKAGWRSKAPCPCRHCGAIFRQPSFTIPHRYHHRGRHSHRCQCGRAFKHRLHLLRHCVQHAETVSYICASCGGTFTGAKLLAQHLRGKSVKKSHSGCVTEMKIKKKCRMAFSCNCGQLFHRPSAYIWHQLRNREKEMNC